MLLVASGSVTLAIEKVETVALRNLHLVVVIFLQTLTHQVLAGNVIMVMPNMAIVVLKKVRHLRHLVAVIFLYMLMQVEIAGPVIQTTIKVVQPVAESLQMLVHLTVAIIGLVIRVIKNQVLVV